MVTVEKQSGIELVTVQTDNNGNFTYLVYVSIYFF